MNENDRNSPRIAALVGKTKRDFEVVVSRYQEDLSWVEPMWGDHATIYDKSGAQFPGRVSLPNVGREAGTYLYHIVHRWDDLAERTLFLQGNPFDHATLPWDSYVLSSDRFVTCFNVRSKMDETFVFWPFGELHEIFAPDKYAWWKDVIESVPMSQHDYNWGAQFAADKRLIQMRGREYWQRLYEVSILDELVLATRKRYSSYEIGVMFEISWAQILSSRSK